MNEMVVLKCVTFQWENRQKNEFSGDNLNNIDITSEFDKNRKQASTTPKTPMSKNAPLALF